MKHWTLRLYFVNVFDLRKWVYPASCERNLSEWLHLSLAKVGIFYLCLECSTRAALVFLSFGESSFRTSMDYRDILNQSYNNMTCCPFLLNSKTKVIFSYYSTSCFIKSIRRSHKDGLIANWWQFPKPLTQGMPINNLIHWGLVWEDFGFFKTIFTIVFPPNSSSWSHKQGFDRNWSLLTVVTTSGTF